MSLLLLLVGTGGWSGFTRLIGAGFPLAVLVPLCGEREREKGERETEQFLKDDPYAFSSAVSPLCVVLFLVLSYKRPPHWVVQIFLMIGAFVMSIAWLNLIANEVVSVLQALGLLAGISTGNKGVQKAQYGCYCSMPSPPPPSSSSSFSLSLSLFISHSGPDCAGDRQLNG